PGDAVTALDANGNPVVSSGTSLAAPVVTGLAALLLDFDSTLTARQLDSLVRSGAVAGGRTAGGIPIVNAYESLKLAAQKPGAPLCGNRVWAEGKVLYAQRAGGPEPLYTANDSLGLLNPYHGGRRIDFVENGVGDGAIIYQNGSWTRVTDPQSLPPGLANATWNSLFGMPHDGDSLATSTQTASTGGVTVTVRYGTPFAAGRTIGTLPVPLLASTTTTCGTMIAQHDSTGAFTGYQCTGQIADGSFETASSRTTVPPMGGRIFLLVNRFYTQSLGVTDSLLCPGFGYDPFGNMNCYNRVVTYDQTSQRAELYEFPIQGGSGTPPPKWSRNQQTLHWLGLSETGSEGVGATSQFVAGVPTGCRIEYLDPATGTAVGATIPNPVACSARGTGGIADIRMASVRLPLDSPPKPRHRRR
ncbi:MAG TPA: hypothetical protein VLB12_10160, partial [Gemmatimonadales bacterium]|nr:hypothetical protein [Gemmatimonadales bacterium]